MESGKEGEQSHRPCKKSKPSSSHRKNVMVKPPPVIEKKCLCKNKLLLAQVMVKPPLVIEKNQVELDPTLGNGGNKDI
jgi:hypothetical protein